MSLSNKVFLTKFFDKIITYHRNKKEEDYKGLTPKVKTLTVRAFKYFVYTKPYRNEVGVIEAYGKVILRVFNDPELIVLMPPCLFLSTDSEVTDFGSSRQVANILNIAEEVCKNYNMEVLRVPTAHSNSYSSINKPEEGVVLKVMERGLLSYRELLCKLSNKKEEKNIFNSYYELQVFEEKYIPCFCTFIEGFIDILPKICCNHVIMNKMTTNIKYLMERIRNIIKEVNAYAFTSGSYIPRLDKLDTELSNALTC